MLAVVVALRRYREAAPPEQADALVVQARAGLHRQQVRVYLGIGLVDAERRAAHVTARRCRNSGSRHSSPAITPFSASTASQTST